MTAVPPWRARLTALVRLLAFLLVWPLYAHRWDATLHHVLLGRPQRRAMVRGAAPLYPNPVTVKRMASGARWGAALTRALRAREMDPLWCVGRRNRPPRAPSHSLNRQDSGFLRRGALRVMLDKAGGDMVPLRLNLRPPKEKEVSGISIHRLLWIKDLRS